MEYLVRIHQIVTQEQYDQLHTIGLVPDRSLAQTNTHITFDDIDRVIKDIINARLCVTDDAYVRNDRKRNHCIARFFRSAYLYKYTDFTMTQCAEYCGYKDHTGTVYARTQVDQLMDLGMTASSYRLYYLLGKELDEVLKEKFKARAYGVTFGNRKYEL